MDLNRRDWYFYSDSSSDSSEERFTNDWESSVNADGSLYFVKNYPRRDDSKEEIQKHIVKQIPQYDKSAGILGRFMRRRSSRRSSRKKDGNKSMKKDIDPNQNLGYTKYVKEDRKEQEPDDALIFVRINLDQINLRQMTLEFLFGLKIIVKNFNVIIIGIHQSKASLFESKVNIGDRLYSINGTVITSHNLEQVLLELGSSSWGKEVLLGFQKMKKEPITKELSPQNLTSTNEKEYFTANGGVLYAKFEGLSEAGPVDQGIIYSFPKKGNKLAQIRGAFFTLSHLLSTISSSLPKSTTIRFNGSYINVLYVHEKSELFLVSLPNSNHFLEESLKIVTSVARCLEFMFQSLTRCFSDKYNSEFLDSFFYKLLSKTKLEDPKNVPNWEFEQLLPVPCSFYLPKEIYMQIDDALNELESNYIQSHSSQRLYTIIGSCYFYKGFMVCNHLPNKDLLDVTALMKQNDILHLCKEGVKDLIYWKEVYPISCKRGLTLPCSVPYSTPIGRWFLLITGMDHSFLATLFEAGAFTSRLQRNTGPHSAYIDETQETLRHIMKIELPLSISKQLCTDQQSPEDLREQTKSTSTDSSSSLSSYADLQVQQNKQHFNTKVRQSVVESIRATSSYTVVGYEPAEEFIPVLGRRAERELALETNSQSRVSVSDISDDSDWLKDYKMSNKNYSIESNDSTKTISCEDFMTSSRFPENENVLIHFLNFEASEGILITSIAKNDKSMKYQHIMQTFRQHVHKIQKIFLNTILFKKLKSQDTQELLNKSLVAVNEYGTLFHYNDEFKENITETYWVVGKLFFMPHPREIYICYLDTCPQNTVEIAFQLALSCTR